MRLSSQLLGLAGGLVCGKSQIRHNLKHQWEKSSLKGVNLEKKRFVNRVLCLLGSLCQFWLSAVTIRCYLAAIYTQLDFMNKRPSELIIIDRTPDTLSYFGQIVSRPVSS